MLRQYKKKHVSALAAHISRFFPCCLLFHARVTNERQRNECGGNALRTTKKETKQTEELEQERRRENFRSQKKLKKSKKKKKKNDAFA